MAHANNPFDSAIPGQRLTDAGDFQGAIDYYTRQIPKEKAPHIIFHLTLCRAELYLRLGKHDAANADFNSCISHFRTIEDSSKAVALLGRARISHAKKDDESALSDLVAALNIGNEHILAAIYFQRAQVYQALGKYEAAAADLVKAIDREYEVERSCYQIAVLYLDHLPAYQGTAHRYTTKLQPYIHKSTLITKDEFNFAHGRALYYRGIYEQAIPTLQSVCATENNFQSEAHFFLAKNYMTLGRHSEALAELKLTKNPSAPANIEFVSGLQAYKLNQRQVAEDHLLKALFEVHTENASEKLSLTEADRLLISYLLNKMGTSVSMKSVIATEAANPDKSLRGLIGLALAYSLPNKGSNSALADTLKLICNYHPNDIMPFLADEFVACLLQPHVRVPVWAIEDCASYKEAYVEFLKRIVNPRLRQNALLQALIPDTVFGSILNLTRGSTTPTLKSSQNKQQIALALANSLQTDGLLLDQDNLTLINNYKDVQTDIQKNCRVLQNMFDARHVVIKDVSHAAPVVQLKVKDGVEMESAKKADNSNASKQRKKKHPLHEKIITALNQSKSLDALKLLKEAEDLNCFNANKIMLLKGIALYCAGEYLEAKSELLNLISRNPKPKLLSNAYYRLSWVHGALGEYDDAISALSTSNHPDTPARLHFYKGLKAYNENKKQEAEQELESALSTHTINGEEVISLVPSSWLLICYLLTKLGRSVNFASMVQSHGDGPSLVLERRVVLCLIYSLPDKGNLSKFIEQIELIAPHAKQILPYQKDIFIASLLQRHLQISVSDAKNMPNAKSFEDLILNVKNPAIRQNALLQALIPETFLGSIFNNSRELTKQKIAAALTESLQQKVWLDQENIILLMNHDDLKNDIKNNEPALHAVLMQRMLLPQPVAANSTFKTKLDLSNGHEMSDLKKPSP